MSICQCHRPFHATFMATWAPELMTGVLICRWVDAMQQVLTTQREIERQEDDNPF